MNLHGPQSSVAGLEPGVPRPRRLRRSEGMRALVRETTVGIDDLICPLFVSDAISEPTPVHSMPGVTQWPVDRVLEPVTEWSELGIRALLLFGIPAEKDPVGSGADAADGVVQRAVRRIRTAFPELVLAADVCLCEYTDHGHCGLLGPSTDTADVLNDETLERLASIALSLAEAGADVVAPSGMIDGAVGTIRTALDTAGYQRTAILGYSAKYASAFYGPFRDAADGAPRFGDRQSHQMDPANAREALREVELDMLEGVDLIMVKPALAYLDIVRQAREQVPELPLVAYNVSGEYAMVKAAAERGWLDERRIVLETLTAMKRAGADMIITYHAPDAARWLSGGGEDAE